MPSHLNAKFQVFNRHFQHLLHALYHQITQVSSEAGTYRGFHGSYLGLIVGFYTHHSK